MSVTYGFYNSIDDDRMYDANQMSSIFDGIINDGVFMNIGAAMHVTAAGDNMVVYVDTGRAWFNHTWTLNDAILPLTVPEAELVLNRIDAVILEVNSNDAVRANEIKILKGVPATEPVRPTLEDSEHVHQHALAYIYVASEVTVITQSDITNCIGTSECPFIDAILETIDGDMLLAQWNDQFERWFASIKNAAEDELNIYTDILTVGETEITIYAEAITTDSVLSFFTSIYGVAPDSVNVQNGFVTMTFDAQETDMKVGVSVDA